MVNLLFVFSPLGWYNPNILYRCKKKKKTTHTLAFTFLLRVFAGITSMLLGTDV